MQSHLLRSVRVVTSALLMIGAGSFAAEESSHYTLKGYGHWQIGELVKAHGTETVEHQWLNSSLLGLDIQGHPSERTTISASPEFKFFYPFPEKNNVDTRRPKHTAYINEMNGNYAFGDVENPWAQVRLGLFNFKYNPDAKDFGEYLFRTGTYPPTVFNNFDYAKARLCGLDVQLNPVQELKINTIFNSELQQYPLYDFSLSFLAEYKLLNAFNFGAGVDFARLIPNKNNKTSPTENSPGVDAPAGKALRYAKSATDTGDTGYSGRYSFKSTKLMVRGSFDPKAFLPEFSFFGKEDLKLYFEVAVTGLPVKTFPDSSHPDLYGKLSRLMPMVVGFNIPAFKLFDVLSVEVEYFQNRMPNDYERAILEGVPLPTYVSIRPPSKTDYDPANYKERDLGWAFYASKEVVKGISLVGQIAYDHMRMPFVDGSESTSEAMTKKGDWAWQAKSKFSF